MRRLIYNPPFLYYTKHIQNSNLRIGQQARRGSGKQYLKRKEVPCGRGEIGGDGFSEIHMMKMKLDEEDRRKAQRRLEQEQNQSRLKQQENKDQSWTPIRKNKREEEAEDTEVVMMPIVNLVGGWGDLGPPPPVPVQKEPENESNEY